jgi:hypothetical protein
VVSAYTGSFRGVCDQPVTDHDGSISAGVRHIRRVFGARSVNIRAAPPRRGAAPRDMPLVREVQRLSQEGA